MEFRDDKLGNPKVMSIANPLVCAKCAAEGPTCCQLRPGDEDFCPPVSEPERLRLGRITGLDTQEHLAMVPNSNRFLDNMTILFPRDQGLVRDLYPRGGVHWRLKTGDDGRCVFLAHDGCRLPRQARPLYCRLFPFWMNGDQLQIFACPTCRVQREGDQAMIMLRKLGMSSARLQDLFAMLRREWGIDRTERRSASCS